MPVEFLGIASTNDASEINSRSGGSLDLDYTGRFGRCLIPLVRAEVARRDAASVAA